MLEIESVTFRNFLSYGNYDTTMDVGSLGPCLITGENGAGKSTAINAILYALFGRTMHGPRPGDRIINRTTGNGCLISLRLKNGDVITRTRKLAGHNELVVERGGDVLLSTLSTTPNQQAQLNKIYGLDWHNFCNTSFLTQIGRTWFELPEPHRKKEIERALRIDRLTVRAQVAKGKMDVVSLEFKSTSDKLESIKAQIDADNDDLEEARRAHEAFDGERRERLKQVISRAKEYKKQYDELETIDVDDLAIRWAAVEKELVAAAALEKRAYARYAAKASAEAREREVARIILAWQKKAGRMCAECEQEIPHQHSASRISPKEKEWQEAKEQMAAEKAAGDGLMAEAAAKKEVAASLRPAMSVNEARQINARREDLRQTAIRFAEQAQKIKSEDNPHTAIIAKLEARIAERATRRDGYVAELERIDLKLTHYAYIHKAYNDRKRIKSYSIGEYTPMLNNRLRHYLDKFKIDVDLEITDSLSVKANGPDYDFSSGGERKRIDVAFMLARFDVQEALYGRQCNVLVMDEVDSRMDTIGCEALAGIILDDLAHRVDTVLVVSHKPAMLDVFPRQIMVKKHSGFSVMTN